jgi:3-oxoacyl-(acyl-carrier-protein) synthase
MDCANSCKFVKFVANSFLEIFEQIISPPTQANTSMSATPSRKTILVPKAPPLITGLGVVSPAGQELGPLYESLLTGTAHIDTLDWGTPEKPAHAVKVKGFAPEPWVKPMAIRRLDWASKFAVVSAAIALADAGISAEDRTDMAVVVGTATLGTLPLVNMLEAIFGPGPETCSASDFPVTVANAAAGQIAILHGLKGPNLTVSQKECSGVAALSAALFLLESGQAERVLVCGTDDYPKKHWEILTRLGSLTHNTAHGPYSAGRSGVIEGEGSYSLVLETPAAAARRGARAVARLLAAGDTHLGGVQHRWPGNGAAYGDLLAQFVAVEKPAAVIGCGNGGLLDKAEAAGLAQFMAETGCSLPVSNFKFGLGESGAAAMGMILLAVASLKAGRLPPITGTREIDPSLPKLNYQLGVPLDLPPGPLLVGAISHGGSAAAALIGAAAADAAAAPF